ncbi:MAG: electron transport protein SCO1/SenC [Verrucomicrobiales bacterium]|nr:electron transport protein SCO1/SenC [Verrucomicrobiales bacterium]
MRNQITICFTCLCLAYLTAFGKPVTTSASVKTYQTKGTVREVSLDHRSTVIRHDAIPDYMPQMTMEFTVLDSEELNGISPGDEISFHLIVTDESHWIDTIRPLKSSPGKTSQPWDPTAVNQSIALKPGQTMPDHEFLSEDGKTLRFSDFRGKVVAFTFIFSRCPLPDFCPRMSKNFEQARALLKNDSREIKNWQFLSISFDPEFDKPAVLARYAHSYRGNDPAGWTFAAASTNTLALLTNELDLRVNRDGNGFSHNLRTIILDPIGRIHRQLEGNRWTAQELADEMKKATAAGKTYPSR